MKRLWPQRRSRITTDQGARLAIDDPEEHLAWDLATALELARRPSTSLGGGVHDLAREVIDGHLSKGRRGLALCGVSYGTGTTFTATCLAVALAEAEVPTLLVEANLRRPSLHKALSRPPASPGLLQFLRGKATRFEVISDELLPNLSVVFAGGVAEDADELLAAKPFGEMVRQSMRTFGCVVVDTPPANRHADAITAAAAVGSAAIVGRRQYTLANDAAMLATQLKAAGVTVVGAIFNRY